MVSSPDQTRRRLGARQPLCGMGVTSVIALTSRPAAWSERIACSRPAPGPFTYTSTWRMPCSIARRAAPSAESAAAYGVLLREPLKPATPADPQLTTAPVGSVIVMIVLLNVAWMWTCPAGTFLRSRRRDLTAFLRSGIPWQVPRCFLRRYFLRRTPTVRFGPRRWRALVFVRWPRTGRLRRWRTPRYEPISIRRLMFSATSRRRSP